MVCLSLLLCRREGSATHEEVSGIQKVKIYKYKELRAATGDFSPDNKIGQGGFGAVYQFVRLHHSYHLPWVARKHPLDFVEGTLKNGKIAAIKVLSAESKQGVNEFLAEIKAIAYIQHENLVKLYGCCVEGNHRILVYNYLENNSLARTLLGTSYRSNGIDFTWETRASIGIGIAHGLAFLHEEVSPHIVHRDIKASNILLDSDLTPKISDFGLAKLFPDNVTHVSTRVAGTMGYLAPEYAVRGRLTDKADVYSFGVLLLEIVSGRHNTNSRLPIGERFLLQRAWEYHECNELLLLVDDDLDGCYDTEQAFAFLETALLCTQDDPKLRPSMSTVVKMLTGEFNTRKLEIQKPGLLSDLMLLRVQNARQEKKSDENCGKKSESDTNVSSSFENMEDSGLSSPVHSTYPGTTFSNNEASTGECG